jgi:hypothetical protein
MLMSVYSNMATAHVYIYSSIRKFSCTLTTVTRLVKFCVIKKYRRSQQVLFRILFSELKLANDAVLRNSEKKLCL